jgi:hypothetical protein
MVSSKWLLSVSLKPNGDLYPKYTLIDKQRQKSTRFNCYKHCLQKSVAEKLALVRLMRDVYDNHSVIGTWIGARHFVVALDKDEYKYLLELTYGGNTRKQSERPREEDTAEVS